MSMLSGARFAASGDGGGSQLPKPISISRVLLWVQAVVGLLLSALILWGTYQQQQMSDSELAKVIKDRVGEKVYDKEFKDNPPGQELFNYPFLYLLAGLMVVLLVVLVFCALRIGRRQKSVKYLTLVAQGVLIPFSLWELSQIGCVLILPGIAVIVMLLSRTAKEWYDTAPTPETAD